MPANDAGPDTTWDHLGIDFYLVGASGTSYRIHPPYTYSFGRDETCNFRMNDGQASRFHCELRWDPASFWSVLDKGSRNGTHVNGLRLHSEQAQQLLDFNVLRVGARQFTYYSLPRGADIGAFLKESVSTLAGLATMDGVSTEGDRVSACFQGQVGRGGLVALLEFFAMTRKTGRLDLSGKGAVWLEDGQPWDAQQGTAEGEDALRALALDPGETFSFLDGEHSPRGHKIEVQGNALLLELARPSDSSMFGVELSDLAKAQSMQTRMLARVPELVGYDIGINYTPHSAVGGDLYDIGPMPDGRILVVLGDVSGHGIHGALVVAVSLKALRMLRQVGGDLLDLVGRLNDEIAQELLPGQFVTLFAATLEPSNGCIAVILAGHHPAYLMREGQTLERIGQPGLALGLKRGAQFKSHVKVVTAVLKPGDALMQCTDGILEAVDTEGRQFDENGFDAVVVKALADGDAKAGVERLNDALNAYAPRLDDDVTVMAIARRRE